VKEEAAETHLTNAGKEDRLLVQVLKANSASKTFNTLNPGGTAGIFFGCRLMGFKRITKMNRIS
jgi:hypothetical protein